MATCSTQGLKKTNAFFCRADAAYDTSIDSAHSLPGCNSQMPLQAALSCSAVLNIFCIKGICRSNKKTLVRSLCSCNLPHFGKRNYSEIVELQAGR